MHANGRSIVNPDRLADADVPVVVGMACRFSGADGIGAYWQRLLSARSALGPAERWPQASDLVGGFLDGHDEFDARFFRISPNEARCMDPQQRLLLQTVQHAVDDAQLATQDLQELRCGVFTASLPGDYRNLMAQRPELALGGASFLGNAPSTLSGRISYFYNVSGPSLTLDSACSSSLSALQLAQLNLQAGQCEAAIVGAVSVFSTPEVLSFARNARMSSPSGASLPFTGAADGFIPAEGVAAIVLMRKGDARSRGLRVLGEIVGSGLNHNGTTNGLSAPSGAAQAALMTEVYRRHGVDISQIALVEAHGTGTELGDPLELSGLRKAFEGSSECRLGAVKPLIGHTLVCSGLAGVIKVLLSFRHDTIPPASVADVAAEYLDVAPLQVNHEPVPWPVGKPLAAVSAFGFTGSNGHLVLRKPEPARSELGWVPGGDALPFCVSADSEASLAALLDRLTASVRQLPEDQLADLSQLLLGRPRRAKCRTVVARTRDDLLAQLTGSAPAAEPLSQHQHELVTRWEQGDLVGLRARLVPPARLATITMPDYPFRRQRHWVIDEPVAAEPVAAEPASAALTERLCAELAAMLGVTDAEDALGPDTPVASLGLDSLSALQLLTPYQERESPVRPHDLFNYATVADLAAGIEAGTAKPNPASPITSSPAPVGTALTRPVLVNTALASTAPAEQLRWHEQGAGPTTVLLPPMNADERAWTQQIPALLARGRRILVPVYPGHRGVAFDAERFSLTQLADEIAAKVGPAGADLVGWSLGGCVAALIALRSPDRVRSLVLLDTAPRYGPDVFERTLELREELRLHRGVLEAVFDRGGDLSAAFGGGAPMEVLASYFEALTSFDIVAQLGEISSPCLVIRGQDDVVVDAASTELFRAVPGARLHEIPGHGHYVPLTAGRALNATIEAFWSDPARGNRN
jgi:3-oxoacyl-(acyl-carrier-protein) synthase/pimeloyl-ACP methyl ester carboxylesterase/acyl carrier protein